MTCRTCRAEDRDEIDLALLSGQGLRSIADQFDISKTSLIRHRNAHISESMVSSKRAEELTRADVLVATAAGLLDRAVSLLNQAEAAQDVRGATGALKECRATVELLSKLKPEPYDDSLTPSPLQVAQWTEIAAQEFVGRPRLADEFAHELLDAFFETLKSFVPQLGPGAAQRLAARMNELDEEDGA